MLNDATSAHAPAPAARQAHAPAAPRRHRKHRKRTTPKGFITGEVTSYKDASAKQDAREREFTKLYKQSYELVYNYVRTRMAGDDAVEDVVSEAYLQAARHFDSFDPARAKFSTWVIKIATNTMISYWRKSHPTTTLEDVPEVHVAQPATQDEIADRDFVDHLLQHLNETERQIVVMKYREGYRNVEIANELDMNASTVSTKLANALAKMRAIAEREM